MKTSGLFTVHSQVIPLKSIHDEIQLWFFGDVHRDSPAHAHGKWQEFLELGKEAVASGANVWFMGMGDYLDSTSTSERECLGHISSKMHETFRNDIEALQLAKCEMFAKEIAFMKGRLVGMLNGNHYFQFRSDINTDQKICDLLGAKYLGVCSFVRLYFRYGNGCVARDLFLHHGAGAARLIGGSMNRVQQMAEGAEADIYAMGHDHKRGAVPAQPRLFLSSMGKGGLQVCQREPIVVRSGSYLASYTPGQSNYNVDAARPPSSLGHVQVHVRFKRPRGGDRQAIDVEMRTLV